MTLGQDVDKMPLSQKLHEAKQEELRLQTRCGEVTTPRVRVVQRSENLRSSSFPSSQGQRSQNVRVSPRSLSMERPGLFLVAVMQCQFDDTLSLR
ncbi:hypothetical protein RRG08_050596 [Elysia crispata]|uniref:Uncharacterized protein n=1 Tax=Elysia crispata TaxID=231223 RepID=A0AAE1DBL6_9GAST|nr:hypothetical protein RRG08_050596 [Elysia crispata]